MIKDILEKEEFNIADIVTLLETKNGSEDYYYLLYKAQEYARTHFSKGYIFTQIGLNTEPCSGNCKFCSMAKDYFRTEKIWEMGKDELISRVKNIPDYVSDIFLMTTADYDKDKFIEYCKLVREIKPNSRLVANFGDFDDAYGRRLKDVGVSACYHIRRLREGIDTDINIKVRERTIDAIEKAGIELYYCIEPIGKEHSYREIAEEINFAREKRVDVMAVMRRVNVLDTGFNNNEISLMEVTKIVAVAMLVVRPRKSMNVHEPNEMSMIAGVNQLYAEEGGNPRDHKVDTSLNRGISAERAKKILEDSGWML